MTWKKWFWNYMHLPFDQRPPEPEKRKHFLTIKQIYNMANKETKEGLRIPAKLIDSIYASTADGSFNLLQDFANFIDDIGAIQPGIEGLRLIDEENATMPIQEREELRQSMMDDMPNVNIDDRYDITDGITGILSFFRIGWRKGFERGQEDLKAKLKSGEISVSDL